MHLIWNPVLRNIVVEHCICCNVLWRDAMMGILNEWIGSASVKTFMVYAIACCAIVMGLDPSA